MGLTAPLLPRCYSSRTLLATDASLLGSGAVLQESNGTVLKAIHGTWKGAKQHINVLDLLAAEHALKAVRPV